MQGFDLYKNMFFFVKKTFIFVFIYYYKIFFFIIVYLKKPGQIRTILKKNQDLFRKNQENQEK